MNIERLRILENFLRNLKPTEEKKFDMGVFWHKMRHRECGFAACALGWATRIPEFSALGFQLDLERWHEHDLTPILKAKLKRNGEPSDTELQHEGFQAAEVLFEISDAHAVWLFEPSHYIRGWYSAHNRDGKITPTMVADRIAESINGTYPETFQDLRDHDEFLPYEEQPV